MGLNILKWTYNLGVKHERQRIASFIQSWGDGHVQLRNDAFEFMSQGANASQRNKKKETDIVRGDMARELLNQLFYAETKYVNGSSIMYPEEDN